MNKIFVAQGGGIYSAPTIEIESFVTESGFSTSVEFIESLEPDDTLVWD